MAKVLSPIFIIVLFCSCCSIKPAEQIIIDAARNPGQRVCKLIQQDKVADLVVDGIYCVTREGGIDPAK